MISEAIARGASMRTAMVLALVLAAATACQKEQQAATETAATKTSAPVTTTVAKAGEPRDMSGQRMQRKLTPAPAYLESALLGGDKAADGTVATEKSQFSQGDAVRLTMKLKESPAGLQTRVEWHDASGRTIHEERRPMNGQKVVTFELTKPLDQGGYKAIGYWGGNVAGEFPFTVGGKKKS